MKQSRNGEGRAVRFEQTLQAPPGIGTDYVLFPIGGRR
jgi:hypothetical protein